MKNLKLLSTIILINTMFTQNAISSTYHYSTSLQFFSGSSGLFTVTGNFTYDDTISQMVDYSFSGTYMNDIHVWSQQDSIMSITNSSEIGNMDPFNFFAAGSYPGNEFVLGTDYAFGTDIGVGNTWAAATRTYMTDSVLGGIWNQVKLDPYGTNSITLTGINAVPLPAALPLFASAILGLGFFNRKRKNKLAVAV